MFLLVLNGVKHNYICTSTLLGVGFFFFKLAFKYKKLPQTQHSIYMATILMPHDTHTCRHIHTQLTWDKLIILLTTSLTTFSWSFFKGWFSRVLSRLAMTLEYWPNSRFIIMSANKFFIMNEIISRLTHLNERYYFKSLN